METNFEKFQLEEYKNISNAHFETNKQISLFFRYYLLIASAPALIFLWFGKSDSFINDILRGVHLNQNLFVGFFLIVISIISTIACFYIINFRLDSILYARTVNGIRRYFYESKEYKYEDHIRVLPKKITLPRYWEFHTFTIIIIAFSLINSVYLTLGTRIIAGVGDIFFEQYFPFSIPIIFKNYTFFNSIIIAGLPMIIIHISYYRFFCNYRNYSYLRSHRIGIDIDGVLNKHRDIFCTMLHDKTGKTLWAKDINKIPVHQIENTTITRDDEFDVFNDPKYWEDQEIIEEGVSKIIKELRNSYGYKVNLHSYRPWPQYSYGTHNDEDLIKTWEPFSIKELTKRWLHKHKIEYDNIFIEKSSIDSHSIHFSLFGKFFGIAKGSFRNRFFYTSKKPYRYFVEDTPDNAVKLARNCDYVFLLEQPYNTPEVFPILPSNVIRVKNWVQIRDLVKEFG